VLLNKVAALDFFVKNFNIGLQVIRTIITHGDHGFVFFPGQSLRVFSFYFIFRAEKRFAPDFLHLQAVFLWQNIGFWHILNNKLQEPNSAPGTRPFSAGKFQIIFKS